VHAPRAMASAPSNMVFVAIDAIMISL